MKKSLLLTLSVIFLTLFASAQTQYYDGTYNDNEISAQINWKKDETLTGSYFFLNSPTEIYKLTGTNFVQGEIEIVESYNGRRTGSGTLRKTINKGQIIWSGTIKHTNGSRSVMYLARSK